MNLLPTTELATGTLEGWCSKAITCVAQQHPMAKRSCDIAEEEQLQHPQRLQ